MTSVNIGASTGLRARLSDYKQGRKEEAAKKQGQGYLFSRLVQPHFWLVPQDSKSLCWLWQSPKLSVPPEKLPCGTLLEFSTIWNAGDDFPRLLHLYNDSGRFLITSWELILSREVWLYIWTLKYKKIHTVSVLMLVMDILNWLEQYFPHCSWTNK